MDTDELSQEAYTAIIETTENFHYDLTLQFGLLSYECNTENEFLDESELMINDWLNDWDLEELIMDIFYDDLPRKQDFKKILQKILTNIEKVRKIEIEKRHFDFC